MVGNRSIGQPQRIGARAFAYALAVMLPVAVVALKLGIPPLGAPVPFLLFFSAITIVAWWGGLGPGILASVWSLGLAGLFLYAPRGSFGGDELTEASAFLVEALAIVAISHTRHRALEQARVAGEVAERSREALGHIAKERAELFQIAGHELRTPLTALRLQLQMAQRSQAQGSADRVGSFLERALATTDHITALLTRLMEGDRPEADRRRLTLQPLDLREIVRASIESVGISESGRIVWRDEGAPTLATTEPVEARRILDNLLTNALKYGGDRGPIEVRLEREADQAVITVLDHGDGIPLEEQARLFTPFYRTSTARGQAGTGLGLYIAAQIARQLGGTLSLARSDADGSAFVLRLPAS